MLMHIGAALLYVFINNGAFATYAENSGALMGRFDTEIPHHYFCEEA